MLKWQKLFNTTEPDAARRRSRAFFFVLAAASSRLTVRRSMNTLTPSQRIAAKRPLVSTDSAATFNVLANVCGGGVAGQADAVRLGITRALMVFNAEFRAKLKAEGLVTRDPRAKERKKYGQKGARKRFQ